MKEMFVAFIIALVAGSVWNGMRGDQNLGAMDDTMSGAAGGFIGGQAPLAAPNMQPSPQAAAGQQIIAEVDEGSFQGMVLDSNEPVLVEFYTDNCPHCKKMMPVLGQLAYNGQGVVTLCKINAAKATAIAERYNVSGVPAFALFVDGHLIDSTAGARTFEDLRSWLSINNVSVPAVAPQS